MTPIFSRTPYPKVITAQLERQLKFPARQVNFKTRSDKRAARSVKLASIVQVLAVNRTVLYVRVVTTVQLEQAIQSLASQELTTARAGPLTKVHARVVPSGSTVLIME